MKKYYSPKTYLFCFLFCCLFFSMNAQVGIGTIDPKTQLEVDGAISLREGAPLSLSNGVNADINLGTTPYSFYRITGPTAAFSISGFIPETDADGQILTVVNTTTQDMTILDDTGTSARKIFCPGGNDIVLTGIYANATFQFNTQQNKWYVISYQNGSNPIDSVTLATDYNLTATGSFSDVPAMSLTFVARKSTVLVTMTASGDNTDLAAGIGDFLVYNVTAGAYFGGTHQKLTTFDDVLGLLSSTWSVSFSKPLTGLTVGNTYTLKVQAFFDPLLVFAGTPTLDINAATESFHHHLTLTVMQ